MDFEITKKCKSCGADIPRDASFCDICGAPVTKKAAKETSEKAGDSGAGRKKLSSVFDDLTEVLNSTEEAFGVMYRELCENDIMELQTNIAALKAQIARDGLMDSDFVIEE